MGKSTDWTKCRDFNGGDIWQMRRSVAVHGEQHPRISSSSITHLSSRSICHNSHSCSRLTRWKTLVIFLGPRFSPIFTSKLSFVLDKSRQPMNEWIYNGGKKTTNLGSHSRRANRASVLQRDIIPKIPSLRWCGTRWPTVPYMCDNKSLGEAETISGKLQINAKRLGIDPS
ncbi:uncharacterized protein BDW43DRAFT_41410 [Aspergillus alliaceus]|uniref:uncharacterized protein n=1 Tax=Petromyces alliaceus TaxID=209559 RepID=UPI0012A4C2F7|nr:uncharacterized protein BDW43DRAFT_41410 [Aspergillus alliaceus]KAB8235148.1 hypothetical protein BDW43DRAFT_41410 [Aspergillus alliaceus]